MKKNTTLAKTTGWIGGHRLILPHAVELSAREHTISYRVLNVSAAAEGRQWTA